LNMYMISQKVRTFYKFTTPVNDGIEDDRTAFCICSLNDHMTLHKLVPLLLKGDHLFAQKHNGNVNKNGKT